MNILHILLLSHIAHSVAPQTFSGSTNVLPLEITARNYRSMGIAKHAHGYYSIVSQFLTGYQPRGQVFSWNRQGAGSAISDTSDAQTGRSSVWPRGAPVGLPRGRRVRRTDGVPVRRIEGRPVRHADGAPLLSPYKRVDVPLVKNCNREVQIRGKGSPRQVRHEHPTSSPIEPERHYHERDNHQPHRHEQHECQPMIA